METLVLEGDILESSLWIINIRTHPQPNQPACIVIRTLQAKQLVRQRQSPTNRKAGLTPSELSAIPRHNMALYSRGLMTQACTPACRASTLLTSR